MKTLLLAVLFSVSCFCQTTNPIVRNPFPGTLEVGGLVCDNPLTCGNIPYTFASTFYNFSPITVNQALAAATPATITLAVSPKGVNGSDTFHPIRINDGSPETVIVTGGTCTSGATNCTLSFTPVSSHASGWTLGPADAGINEALQACNTANGGVVLMPAGTITIHGIMDNKRCSKVGQGIDNTILQVASGEFATVPAWNAPDYGSVVDRAANTSGVTLSGYSIDMQGTTQSSVPTHTGNVIFFNNQKQSVISQVGVLHSPNPANFIPILVYGTSSNVTVQLSKIIDDPLTACTNSGAAGYFIQASGVGNKVINSYGEAGCQTMFVAGTSATAGLFQGNTYYIGATTMNALGQQFSADSSGPGWRFESNNCIGDGIAPNCFSAISDDAVIETTDTSFTDNSCVNIGICYQIAGQGNTIFTRRTTIKGGSCKNASVTCVLIQDGVDNLSISSLMADGQGNTPNVLFSDATVAGSIKNIALSLNHWNNGSVVGTYWTSSPGISPVDGLTEVADVFQGNTTGMEFASATQIQHFNISGNILCGNATDWSFGITNGLQSLVSLGQGNWGPNITCTDPTIGQSVVSYGASGNVFGQVTLVNGPNPNIASGLRGDIQIVGPTGAFSLGGFMTPYDGKELTVWNSTTQTMTITDNDASTPAGNRIFTFTGADVTLPAGQSWARFKASLIQGQWLLVGHS